MIKSRQTERSVARHSLPQFNLLQRITLQGKALIREGSLWRGYRVLQIHYTHSQSVTSFGLMEYHMRPRTHHCWLKCVFQTNQKLLYLVTCGDLRTSKSEGWTPS